MRIDLNSDLGESFGAWAMGQDDALMASITSANIACGFHAGDPTVMRRTVALAKRHGVAIGAHPGFPDLVGVGRREMQASPREVEDSVLYQVSALAGIASAEGMRLQHVKAHGRALQPGMPRSRSHRSIADWFSSASPALNCCAPESTRVCGWRQKLSRIAPTSRTDHSPPAATLAP
jgi:UPF0271 protein